MLILSNTDGYNRQTVHITRWGVETRRWRAKVGGGWYVKENIVVFWPWRKNA